jgi:predicted alpha/beta superfamily hydrolase
MSSSPEVRIPGTRRIDFLSGVNGRPYSISLALPHEVPSDKSFPVLYVLDGYLYFASVVEAIRANWNASDVVVVGIGYPDEPRFIRNVLARHAPLPGCFAEVPPMLAACSLERIYDLTLPATDAVLSEQSLAGLFVPTAREVGGLDDFLTILNSEVMPRVAHFVRVESSNQVLFGHSLGGLAVLHAMFNHPSSFRTFIAASPSIWWNRRAVLAGEEQFSNAVRQGSVSPRLLVTMGGAEGTAPELSPQLEVDSAALARILTAQRMLENARELNARLQSLRGSPSYEVADFAVFPECGHGLSPWPAIARGIQFALQAEPGRLITPSA